MSVMMTRTCIPCSKARYSAAVSAQRGVRMRSMIGSFERFRNMTTFCSTPDSSKERRKYSATSFFAPMAAKTMQNLSSPSSLMRACRAICTASSLCFMPEPEKMGSFCPRISVMSVSMVEMPVLI